MHEPESGTVYGGGQPWPEHPSETRTRRDWLIPGALTVLAAGVLTGVLLAAFAFFGGTGEGRKASAGGVPNPPTGVTEPPPEPPAESPSPSPSPSSASGQVPTTGALRSPSLAVCVNADDDGDDLRTARCADTPGQTWRVAQAAGDIYSFVNEDSGKCLDVRGRSRRDGATVQQFRCNGGTNQQWRVRSLGGDRFALINVNSGMCLDVKGSGNKPGAVLQQRRCGSSNDQEWTFAGAP